MDKIQGDLNLKLLIVIGVVSTLLLIEIVVVMQAYFYNSLEAELVAKQVEQPSWELDQLLTAQQAELNSYRWVDRENRRVAVPIDRAIKQYVQAERQRTATRPEG